MSTDSSPTPTLQRSPSLRVADAEEGRITIPTYTTAAPKRTGRSDTSRSQVMADRFLRRGKRKVGVVDSLKAVAFSSCMFTFLCLCDSLNINQG